MKSSRNRGAIFSSFREIEMNNQSIAIDLLSLVGSDGVESFTWLLDSCVFTFV